MAKQLTLEQKHNKMLYPMVRVSSAQARGTGTIIYSKQDGKEHYSTYIITNEHVVSGLISVEDKWSALLRRNRKVDVLGTPKIEFFEYDYTSRVIGGTTLDSQIMAYDKDEDIALLKLKAGKKFDHVAEMYPIEKRKELKCFMPINTVGCGMGNKPVITHGYISGFGYEIENKEFILGSAASIFGNSGGATFLEDSGQYIGMPARITVASLGFSASAITHLGYFIPYYRICKFLEDQVFQFIYDESYTEAQCADMRKRKREDDELRLLKRDNEGGSDESKPAWKPPGSDD
jgi:S1-C subfamily serine protease